MAVQERNRIHDAAIMNFWRAYLVRAIRDLDEWFYAKSAEAFVLDDDERVLGFRWVCSVLDIDPDAMRAKVMDRRLRHSVIHGNRILKDAA
jgi:hypothetical protein